MRAEELRKSILQQAIQGKLVKQNPADEPASVLLERIKEEKEKLVKEGKIKKDKSESYIFKGDDNRYYEKIGKNSPIDITDELPFEIPETWYYSRLKNLVLISTGKKDANFGSENGLYDFFTCALEPIKSNSYSYDGQYIILPGNGANVGHSILYNGKFEAYQRTYLLAKITNFLDFEYLQIVLKAYWKDYNQDKQYGSAIPYIKLGNLEEFLIPVPPLAEQEHIVKRIEELIPLVDEYARLEAKDKELDERLPVMLKQSILQYAMEGKLVKQDPNDEPASVLLERIKAEKEKLIKEGKIKRDKNETVISQDDDKNYYEKLRFEMPNGWVITPLKNICKLITCGYASTPKYEDKGIPFISAKNVKPYHFLYKDYKYISPKLFEKIHVNYKPEYGDILLTRVGAGIGEACIIDNHEIFGLYVSVTLIKLIDISLNEYLLNVLQSPYGLTLSSRNTSGKGSSQGNLNVNNVRDFLVLLPPKIEMEKINIKIKKIINIINS